MLCMGENIGNSRYWNYIFRVQLTYIANHLLDVGGMVASVERHIQGYSSHILRRSLLVAVLVLPSLECHMAAT